MSWPIDNLAVRIGALFRTEGRPADQAFEHDGTHTPPVTSEIVASPCKNFWCNVIRCPNRGVGKLTSRLAPSIDLITIADGKLNLVQSYAVAIVTRCCSRCFAVNELLVVLGIVLFVESGGQPKVGQFDVATAVKKYIVGFDVTSAS